VPLGYRATSGSTRSQAPGNRDSARVISRDRGTRGTNMNIEPEQPNQNKILQDGTSSGSERPEENISAKSDLTKNRARRSGAARRRYNKQQREGGSAQTPPSATESLPTGGEGCAGAGASKHTRSERTTPSPLEDRRSKKFKVTPDQGPMPRRSKG